MNLKKGLKYKFCTCGFSKTLPFCDNKHREVNAKKGTNYKSLKIIPEEDVSVEVSSSNWNK